MNYPGAYAVLHDACAWKVERGWKEQICFSYGQASHE